MKQSLDGLKGEDEAKFGWSEGRGRSKVWLVLKRRTKQSLDGLKAEDEAKFGWS